MTVSPRLRLCIDVEDPSVRAFPAFRPNVKKLEAIAASSRRSIGAASTMKAPPPRCGRTRAADASAPHATGDSRAIQRAGQPAIVDDRASTALAWERGWREAVLPGSKRDVHPIH
jgi:hypothetical protein